MTRKKIIYILLGQEIALIFITVLWLYFRNLNSINSQNIFNLTELNPFKGWSVDPKSFLYGLAASLLLIFFSFIITATSEHFKKSLVAIDDLIISKITPNDFLPIALLSGIGEELFFRGILQLEIGIFWTSIIFALLHFPGKELWIYSLWALFASLYLGNIYAYTGNLFIVITAHILNNLLTLLLWQRYKSKIFMKNK